MQGIVIADLVGETAVRDGFAGLDACHDPSLVDRPEKLARLVADEPAPATALRSERLGGAASHVFADAPNLVPTPRIAGVTEESNVRVPWITVENPKRALTA